MSQIKPGTLCIMKECINPVNNGRVVTALEFRIGPILTMEGKLVTMSHWVLDTQLPCWTGKTTNIAMPYNLIPITPPDIDGFLLDEIIREVMSC